MRLIGSCYLFSRQTFTLLTFSFISTKQAKTALKLQAKRTQKGEFLQKIFTRIVNYYVSSPV